MSEQPKLVCPYTGKMMTIEFHANLSSKSGHYLAGGFNPADPSLDRETLEMQLRMRNGKRNAVRALKCPYTGSPLVVKKDERGLWWVSGNYFSPMSFCMDKQELVYKACMRNGKPLAGVPERSPKVVARSVEAPPSNPVEGLGIRNEKVEETVERMVEEIA